MSYFSNALRTALTQSSPKLSQAELCDKTGIGTSAMSKYVRGAEGVSVGPSVVEKIVGVLPDPHNGLVLAAWLRDQTPEDLAGLVSILPRSESSRIAETAPDPIPGSDIVGGEYRELIAYFARKIHDPVIYNMLESTRRAIEAE